MDNQIYWFITTFNYVEDNTFPYLTRSRCWGFYRNKEDALNTLHNNMTDLWETIYPYAILEPYYEGISGYCFEENRQFFKYDIKQNGYFEIDELSYFKNTIGFAFG